MSTNADTFMNDDTKPAAETMMAGRASAAARAYTKAGAEVGSPFVTPRLAPACGTLVRAAWGSAPCGLSIISSYACGVGAVLALDARIKATTRVGDGCGAFSARLPVVEDFYLLECARLAFDSAALPSPRHLEALISSDVPAGSGLKTSSAVAVAFIGSVLKAAGVSLMAEDVVAAATAAARSARVTQTGSLDDNWCAVLGGVVVAGHRADALADHWAAPEGCEVVILVLDNPGVCVHRRDRRALLSPYTADFEALAARLVATRDIFAVMTKAAFHTARAFGYGSELLDAALKAGALGVSLSGKGPAIGAITRAGQAARVIEAWGGHAGRIIRTRPTGVGILTATDRPYGPSPARRLAAEG